MLPAGWLPSWLEVTEDSATYPFHLYEIAESNRPHGIEAALAELIVHTKCDVAALRRLLNRIGKRTVARLGTSLRPQMRHGDFGEILSIAMLEQFNQVDVPVMKLRVQMDPEQSLHGADVVGFKWREGEEDGPRALDGLVFVETKCRTTPNKAQAKEAHQQLTDDLAKGFADTLEFIHLRLTETDHTGEVLEAFEEYLGRRDEPVEDEYRIFLIFEKAAWKGNELGELPAPEDQLAPLLIHAVLIDQLRMLIDSTWAAVQPTALEIA